MLSCGRYSLKKNSFFSNVKKMEVGLGICVLQNKPIGIGLSVFKNFTKFSKPNVPFLNLRPFQNNSMLFHTSPSHFGLEEFFDQKENWGEQEVKVGRSWKIEELRLKSNEDLHKLWYVLLKEKNMLLTMEEACKEEFKIFPNPERIDKVQDSMNNIENVIKERNRAYWLLETGEVGGERPIGPIVDSLGRHTYRKFKEYAMPDYMHIRMINHPFLRNPIPNQFSRLLREQGIKRKKTENNRTVGYIARLFQRYPDIDMETLQQKYPEYDVAKIKTYKRSRGNHSNNLS